MKHLWIIWIFTFFSLTSFAQELNNKTFYIKSKYTGKVLDVAGSFRDNGANVQQWPYHGGNNQKFKFVKAEQWYYYIRPVHSNKALSAANCSTINTGNIFQYEFHGGANQQFYVGRMANGSYFIQAKCSFLLLSVSSDKSDNNVFHGNEGLSQAYSFELIPASAAPPPSSEVGGSVSGRFTKDGVFACNRFYVEVTNEEKNFHKRVDVKDDCTYLITGIPDGTYKIAGYLEAKVDLIISQTKGTITISQGGRDRVDFGSKVN